MQLKTCSSERTLFWTDVKRFWPIWAAYLLIWLFLGPISMVASIDDEYGMLPYLAARFMENALQPGLWIVFAFCVISAMAVFSYLYSPRSANAEASLPIRRTAQFFIHYLAGLFWLLAANVLIFLFSALACAVFGPENISAIAQWLGMVSLMTFAFYTFAVFCAVLTGNIFALPAVFIIFNFLCPAVETLVKELCRSLIFGLNPSSTVTAFLAPSLYLVQRTFVTTFDIPGVPSAADAGSTVTMNYGFSYNGWRYLFLYAALSALFLIIAVLLYKRRKMETAGDVVAINFLKPVFKYCMAFGCALVGGVLLGALLNIDTSVLSKLVIMLVFGFVGYFGAEMLLQKSFRVFSAWQGYVAVCAILVLFITVCATDVFNIAHRMPSAEKIESVHVSTAGENVDLEEPESIEAVQALHTRLMNREGEGEGGAVPQSADHATYSISLIYTLRNGLTFSRSYSYPISEALLEDDTSLSSAINQLLNCTEAIADRKATAIPVEEAYISSASIWFYGGEEDAHFDLTPKQAEYIYQNGILKDMDTADIGRVWLFPTSVYLEEIEESSCEISINLYRYDPKSDSYEYDSFSTYLLSSSTHTRECLEKFNLLR